MLSLNIYDMCIFYNFSQKKELLDVVRLDNCHRCRAEPFEATIYSLEATDKALERFKGNFQTELTIEVEETSAQQSQEKQERLELPLNFSKEDAVKVGLSANELMFSKVGSENLVTLSVLFIELCLRLILSFCLSFWIQSDVNLTVSNVTVPEMLTFNCIQNTIVYIFGYSQILTFWIQLCRIQSN